jgi:predicted nucleotidyltransferase
MSHQENITRIKAVYNALGPLKDKVVFVGGATVSLYRERDWPEVRITEDVDIVIEIWQYGSYADLEEQLRSIGFVNDQASGIICRFTYGQTVVDIIPTEGKVLGFSNRWYPEGFKSAIDYTIDPQHTIKIFSAPYFLAAKLDAFLDRGHGDGRTSSDFEDIVFLLEHRSAIWNEFEAAPLEVRTYLKAEFRKLLANLFLEEWIDAHIDFRSPPSTYSIIEQLQKFAAVSF